jgi:2-desacetyl-2-hydroxyethyl bacteriochlorophyllide A dehydrogenase
MEVAMSRIAVFAAPRTVGFQELEDRALQPNEVRIKTLFSGISQGTEMTAYRGGSPFYTKRFDPATRLFLADGGPAWSYPLPFGYENVGRVVEVGTEASHLVPGDMVFTYMPHQTEVVISEQDAYHLPEGVSAEDGLFIALLGVAYNAILDARIILGETVAIQGMGVIGQMLVQLVRLSGAEHVVAIDLLEPRLAQARKRGADITINPSEGGDVALQVRQLTGNRGADVVIECTGSPKGLNEAVRVVGFNGTVVCVSFLAGEARGLTLGDEFHHNRIRLISSQAAGVNPELHPRWTSERKLQAAIQVLPRLDLSGLITQRFPFDRAAAAYQLVDEHPEQTIQVILTYT